jgi:hypothetical protein
MQETASSVSSKLERRFMIFSVQYILALNCHHSYRENGLTLEFSRVAGAVRAPATSDGMNWLCDFI